MKASTIVTIAVGSAALAAAATAGALVARRSIHRLIQEEYASTPQCTTASDVEEIDEHIKVSYNVEAQGSNTFKSVEVTVDQPGCYAEAAALMGSYAEMLGLIEHADVIEGIALTMFEQNGGPFTEKPFSLPSAPEWKIETEAFEDDTRKARLLLTL